MEDYMKIINILSLIAISFTLSACNFVMVETDDVTPKDSKFKKLKVVKLNKSARKAIGASNPDDLVVIYKSKEAGGEIIILTSGELNFKGGNTKEMMTKAKRYKAKKPSLV